MGAPSRDEEEAKKMEAGDDTVGQKLDAGALFVLQSKGSWLHCGYHLITSIVAPPLLSLPFAFAALGWSAGMVCLVVGAAVTFYSYNLLSRVLEHHAQQGRRQLRFRDMATDILGMDARAYRLGCLKECTVFELDFGDLLEMKSDILHEAMSSGNHQKLNMMAKSLTRVPADIRDVDWMTKLQSCGYVPERNTIWVLEGILYYLHHVHAMQVLETIAACRTSACTVLLADFMNKNAASLSQTMYHFYHDSPDLLLPSIGFSQTMLSQIGDPQAHFGLLNHPQNLFDKLRRLPRSVETNPEDGTPCRRLYLVEASASPDDHAAL